MTEHTLSPLGKDNDVTRRISNSEVGTWLTCQRKYYYEFALNIEPKQSSGALGRGVLLHDILAEYYTFLKEWDLGGTGHDEAVQHARSKLQTYMSSPAAVFGMETILEVDRLLQGYWNFYQGDANWEILQVEVGHDLPMTEAYEYSLRLDLYVRDRTTGEYILVDHKTAYDFWTEDDLDLSPQFPKYIGALRANGFTVDKAMLNQIRTRSIKAPTAEQLFRRTTQKPSLAKITNAMREQVIVSKEIVAYRALPVEVQAANSVRTLNKQVCKYCNVKSLCLSEYDGGDITVQIAHDFKPRTYGYNPTESADLL